MANVPGAIGGVTFDPYAQQEEDRLLLEKEKQQQDEQRKALETARKAQADRDNAILDQQKAQVKQSVAEGKIDVSSDIVPTPDVAGQFPSTAQFTAQQTSGQQQQQQQSILQAEREQGFAEGAGLAQAGQEAVAGALERGESVLQEDAFATEATTPTELAAEGIREESLGQVDASEAQAQRDVNLQQAEQAKAQSALEESRRIDDHVLRVGKMQQDQDDRRNAYATEVSSDIEPPKPSILNLIGVAIGGFLASRGGGPNLAAQLLNQKIAQETQTELANRKLKMQSARDDLSAGETAIDRANADLRFQLLSEGKKTAGVVKHLEAQSSKGFYTEAQNAVAQQIIGQGKQKLAELAQRESDRQLKLDQFNQQQAQRAQQAPRKGGRRRKPEEVDLTTLPPTARVWDTIGQQFVSGRDAKALKGIEQGGRKGHRIGIKLRDGDKFINVPVTLDPTEAKIIRNEISNRNLTRQAVLQLRHFGDKIKKRAGTTNIIGSNLSSFGITDNERSGFEQARSNLITVRKRFDNTGAATSDKEMEAALLGAFGVNTQAQLANLSVAQQLKGAERFLENTNSLVKGRISSSTGIPRNDMQLENFSETKFLEEEELEQKPDTGAELVASIRGQIRNDDDIKESFKQLETRIDEGFSGRGGFEGLSVTGKDISEVRELIGLAKGKNRDYMVSRVLDNKKLARQLLPKKLHKSLDVFHEQKDFIREGVGTRLTKASVASFKKDFTKELVSRGESVAARRKGQEFAESDEGKKLKKKAGVVFDKVKGILVPR